MPFYGAPLRVAPQSLTSVLIVEPTLGLDVSQPVADAHDWGITQVCQIDRDENIAVGAHGSHQSLYCWQANTTVFSTLTGAPQATSVTAFDNCLLAANIRSGSSDYVQRIQWSDRGSASSWTQGLAGYEDLLAMQGDIRRLVPQENRVLVLGENETWHGYRVDYPPALFRFEPVDTGVGCPYPWTVTNTPLGTMFLGRDYQFYVVPKSGGPPTAIGQRLHRRIRETIDHPERAWSVYDPQTGTVQFNYPLQGGPGRPQRAAWLYLDTGAWAPQSYDIISGGLSPTRGADVQRTSLGTTWSQLSTAQIRWADLTMSWAQLGGTSEARTILIGSANGTAHYLTSNAPPADGTP